MTRQPFTAEAWHTRSRHQHTAGLAKEARTIVHRCTRPVQPPGHPGKHARDTPLNVGKQPAAITRGGALQITRTWLIYYVTYVSLLIMKQVLYLFMISVYYYISYNISLSVIYG